MTQRQSEPFLTDETVNFSLWKLDGSADPALQFTYGELSKCSLPGYRNDHNFTQ